MNTFDVVIQAIRAYLNLPASGLSKPEIIPQLEQSEFYTLVAAHGVQAYVLQGFKSVGILPILPQPVVDSLQRDSTLIGEESLKLTRVLHQVKSILSSNEIDAIAIKGPIFSIKATGGLSHRAFSDIDILVRKDDVPRAIDVLSAAGFREFYPNSIPVSSRALRNGCEIELLDQDENILEVHWNLFPKYMKIHLADDSIWNGSKIVDFFGTKMRCLGDIHELIYFAVHHGGSHRWENIRHIVDFHMLAVKKGLDWNKVWKLASAAGAYRSVLVGLLICRDILGYDIVYEGIPDAAVRTAARLAGFYRRNLEQGDTLTGFQRNWWFLQQRERFADKIRYMPFFIRDALTPTEKDQVFLGRRLPPFLRLFVRLGRLSLKYGKQIANTGKTRRRGGLQ